MEEAAWHVAVSLPAFPDYVCADLKASTLCRVPCAFRVTGVLGLGYRVQGVGFRAYGFELCKGPIKGNGFRAEYKTLL